MSIARMWSKFRDLPRDRRALLLEALWRLVAVRIAILTVRFPRLARRLGPLHPPQAAGVCAAGEPETARAISWAIDRAARLLPLRLVCLPRALAAQQMLTRRRLDCRVHFGAARVAGRSAPETHAWVDSAGVAVTGYPAARRVTEIGFFSVPAQTAPSALRQSLS